MKNDARRDRRAPGVQCEAGQAFASSTPCDPPATYRAGTLAEPVKIAEFWKNRRGETVRVSIEPYQGRTLVHVREFFTDAAGKLAPTKKGICIDILRLPDLDKAVRKALARAQEIGLLPAEGAP